MATENGDNGAPDAWDQDVDNQNETDPGNGLAEPLSHLNVNAAPFVPGQNVFASEFVPVTTNTDGNICHHYVISSNYKLMLSNLESDLPKYT